MVDADELLAVNGFEGVVRPVLLQGAGPALAGVLVAVWSPAAALGATAVALRGGARRGPGAARAGPAPRPHRGGTGHPVRAVVRDLVEGFRYMVGTRWLLVTLVFASLMILLVLGPLEVLVPFAIIERAGGGPGGHSLVLLAFGAGGAIASIVVASLRLPRRYLTVMIVLWSVACVPMVVFGVATTLWPMVVAGVRAGRAVQRPAGDLGDAAAAPRPAGPARARRRASTSSSRSPSCPLSMALAGPVSVVAGLTPVFLVAGLVPLLFGAVALVVGRLGPDELAHPLDAADEVRRPDAVTGSYRSLSERYEPVTTGAGGQPVDPDRCGA